MVTHVFIDSSFFITQRFPSDFVCRFKSDLHLLNNQLRFFITETFPFPLQQCRRLNHLLRRLQQGLSYGLRQKNYTIWQLRRLWSQFSFELVIFPSTSTFFPFTWFIDNLVLRSIISFKCFFLWLADNETFNDTVSLHSSWILSTKFNVIQNIIHSWINVILQLIASTCFFFVSKFRKINIYINDMLNSIMMLKSCVFDKCW